MQGGQPEERRRGMSTKAAAALAIALAVLVIAVIGRPGYGLFLTIGLAALIVAAIGVVAAAVLYLWHRFKPLRDDDIENKRPLGL